MTMKMFFWEGVKTVTDKINKVKEDKKNAEQKREEMLTKKEEI